MDERDERAEIGGQLPNRVSAEIQILELFHVDDGLGDDSDAVVRRQAAALLIPRHPHVQMVNGRQEAQTRRQT